MASLFKRRSTAVSSDLKRLSESETTLAQSRFNVEKITEIQNRFTGGEMLLVPGRIFIREGTLFKSCRKGLKKRQFFLFNDILVYGSIVAKGRYSNQHVLYLSHMTVDAECSYTALADADHAAHPGLESENAFQVNHSEKSFHVIAQSRADKSNWITNLDKQIKKIANENSGDQPVMKAVWIPDSVCKECPLCHQKFNAFIRKHHCRMCGRVVCSSCSPHKADISRLRGGECVGRLERVCTACYKSTCGKVNKEEEDSRATGSQGACRTVHVSWMPGREHVAIQQRVEYVGNNVSLSTIANHGRQEDKEQQRHRQEHSSSQQSINRRQPDSREEDNRVDDSSSSDTEDSDDSSIEATPIPPPRRKKLQHILQKQIASRQAASAQRVPPVTKKEDIEVVEDETDGDNRTAQQVTEDTTAQEGSEDKDDRSVQLDSNDKENRIAQRLSVEVTPQQVAEDMQDSSVQQVSEEKEKLEQKNEAAGEENAAPIPKRRKQKYLHPTSQETTPTTMEATPTTVEATPTTAETTPTTTEATPTTGETTPTTTEATSTTVEATPTTAETTPTTIEATPTTVEATPTTAEAMPTETTPTTITPLTAARPTDVAPRSSRSPSAHVRLRKSKFTTTTNTS